MAKIDLKVVDPKLLEGGTNEPPVQMTYGDTDSPVVIDTDTAFIECEAQGKSAPIKDWVVDFGSHKMKLAGEEGDGNYSEIDFSVAAAIVGQLVFACGIPTLRKLLDTLQHIYVTHLPEPGPEGPRGGVEDAPQVPDGKVPLEKAPEAPKDPELPSPIDLDV